jgi:hypothetical protein
MKNFLDTDPQTVGVWSSGQQINQALPLLDQSLTFKGPTNTTQTPTVPVDPTTKGIYSTKYLTYNLEKLEYSKQPFAPVSIEVLAGVTYPELLPTNVKCPFVQGWTKWRSYN